MDYLDGIIEKIKKLKEPNKTFLIAIDGRGGSGKSILAEELGKRLDAVTIVHLDDFAYPMGGADRRRLLDQVILPLKDNKIAKYQKRDFETKELTSWHEITPSGIVIIEGVITLHDLLEKYYDLKIWIECPPEVGFQRGLRRDKEIYNVDTEKEWRENWMPEEAKAIEEQKPQEKADIVVDGTKNDKPDYAEFSNPKLVDIYNTVCPLDGYEKFYIELAKGISAKTILDLGCGTGLLTCELAKHGYQMIGVEPSKLMLDVARKSPCGDEVKWFQGDALSLEEFSADLAIMTGHVAQFHLDDEYWLKALKSIHQALKPGGYLAFESRNPLVQPWFKDKNNPDLYLPKLYRKVNDPDAGEIEVYTKLIEVNGNRTLGELQYHFNKTGEELISTGEMVFRTREEITRSLEVAGFLIENVYGNWDGSLAVTESPEMIFVAKKF